MSEPAAAVEISVTVATAGQRLDQILRQELPSLSRGALLRLIEQGAVRVDGARARKGDRLREGQRLRVELAVVDERPLPQPELPLEILLSRPGWVAVNKAAGMPTHPLLPAERGTLANALVARFPECLEAGPPREGGLVHRLDSSTSGVLLAARNPAAYRELRERFSAGGVQKRYLALARGRIEEPGRIELPLRSFPGDPRRMQVWPDAPLGAGQEASSQYRPLQQLGELTLVEVETRSGRRHQVRVHLAHLGHPLAGDLLYGGPPLEGEPGAFLHAAELELFVEGEQIRAPLPASRLRRLRDLGCDLPL